MAHALTDWQRIWGPDPEGSVRYSQVEALGFGFCEQCTCWRGKPEKKCGVISAPPGMCGKFKQGGST